MRKKWSQFFEISPNDTVEISPKWKPIGRYFVITKIFFLFVYLLIIFYDRIQK